MRKRNRTKKRACGVCKPRKRGWTIRWSPRELMLLKEWERERKRRLG
jgi:hypothetical protein